MTNWQEYIRERLTAAHRSADEDVILEWAQHAEAVAAARADGSDATKADAHARALVDDWCANAAGVPLAHRSRRPDAIAPPPSASRRWAGLGHDVRYGLRRLARQPGFALVTTLLIAVGVAATTTMASLTYDVLLKPLPFPEPDRLVRLAEHRVGETHHLPNTITNGTYVAWVDAPRTIEAIAAWDTGTSTITVRDQSERARIVSTTASLFAVVPTRPIAGRLFTAAEEPNGAASQVMVLSEVFARRLYVSPAAAVGQTLVCDGTPYQVIGVVDSTFIFPSDDVAAWIPISIPGVVGTGGQRASISILQAVARLKPGVTAQQAGEEGTARADSAPEIGMVGTLAFGTANKPTITATPYLESITADVRPALYVIVVAVVLLFVVAIANVAAMQLARLTSRRRELAIRSALGGAPGRLARQLLAENLVIGGLGGATGGLLALGLLRTVPRLLPATFPRVQSLHADWRVLLFACACAAGSSVAFGLVPALAVRRQNLVEVLVEDGQAPVGGRARTRVGRLRVAILAGQVAVAALLLTGASLFGRSFLALLHADRGYDPHNLATVALPMPDREFTSARRAEVLDAIVDRLARTPGVAAAAASSVMPLLPYEQMMAFRLPPGPGRPQYAMARAQGRLVSSDYFTAMGMSILRGRGFAASDSSTSRMVAVVNQTFARQYLAGDPLGALLPITYASNDGSSQIVVGVVDDVRHQSVTDPPQPEVYLDYRQIKVGMVVSTPAVVARTTGPASTALPTITRIVREVSPGLIADSSMTMDDRLIASLAQPRLYAVLFATFGVFALLVAATGLFGVLSYWVAQRAREFGVRSALGARPRDIVGLVIGQALAVSMAGTTVGLIAAFLLVSFIGTLLYGVRAHDVRTFVLVPAVVFVVAAFACYGPARRAAAIDPLKALRRTQ